MPNIKLDPKVLAETLLATQPTIKSRKGRFDHFVANFPHLGLSYNEAQSEEYAKLQSLEEKVDKLLETLADKKTTEKQGTKTDPVTMDRIKNLEDLQQLLKGASNKDYEKIDALYRKDEQYQKAIDKIDKNNQPGVVDKAKAIYEGTELKQNVNAAVTTIGGPYTQLATEGAKQAKKIYTSMFGTSEDRDKREREKLVKDQAKNQTDLLRSIETILKHDSYYDFYNNQVGEGDDDDDGGLGSIGDMFQDLLGGLGDLASWLGLGAAGRFAGRLLGRGRGRGARGTAPRGASRKMNRLKGRQSRYARQMRNGRTAASRSRAARNLNKTTRQIKALGKAGTGTGAAGRAASTGSKVLRGAKGLGRGLGRVAGPIGFGMMLLEPMNSHIKTYGEQQNEDAFNLDMMLTDLGRDGGGAGADAGWYNPVRWFRGKYGKENGERVTEEDARARGISKYAKRAINHEGVRKTPYYDVINQAIATAMKYEDWIAQQPEDITWDDLPADYQDAITFLSQGYYSELLDAGYDGEQAATAAASLLYLRHEPVGRSDKSREAFLNNPKEVPYTSKARSTYYDSFVTHPVMSHAWANPELTALSEMQGVQFSSNAEEDARLREQFRNSPQGRDLQQQIFSRQFGTSNATIADIEALQIEAVRAFKKEAAKNTGTTNNTTNNTSVNNHTVVQVGKETDTQ